MTPQEIDAWLAQTLDDRKFSRAERQALGQILSDPGADRLAVRRRAFELARDALPNPTEGAVLDWLEGVTEATRAAKPTGPAGGTAEAHFSPGEECPRAIEGRIGRVGKSIDVCVFTITDDRLADALLAAHRRGVAVRIISDDAKAEDLGSDVDRFERAGLTVRVDRSPFHMHHKFALFDGATLLTGSYNWTRGAARDNEENLIVTDDPRLVAPFAATFEKLWAKLG